MVTDVVHSSAYLACTNWRSVVTMRRGARVLLYFFSNESVAVLKFVARWSTHGLRLVLYFQISNFARLCTWLICCLATIWNFYNTEIEKRAFCADLGRSSITDLGRSSISGRMALMMLPTNTDESDHCSLQEAFRKFRRKKQVNLSCVCAHATVRVFDWTYTDRD